MVEFVGDLGESFGAVLEQVCGFGEVVAEQAVGVLVGAALPRDDPFAEVDGHPDRAAELAVACHLDALIPGLLCVVKSNLIDRGVR